MSCYQKKEYWMYGRINDSDYASLPGPLHSRFECLVMLDNWLNAYPSGIICKDSQNNIIDLSNVGSDMSLADFLTNMRQARSNLRRRGLL